jgi:hypothetical protein
VLLGPAAEASRSTWHPGLRCTHPSRPTSMGAPGSAAYSSGASRSPTSRCNSACRWMQSKARGHQQRLGRPFRSAPDQGTTHPVSPQVPTSRCSLNLTCATVLAVTTLELAKTRARCMSCNLSDKHVPTLALCSGVDAPASLAAVLNHRMTAAW